MALGLGHPSWISTVVLSDAFLLVVEGVFAAGAVGGRITVMLPSSRSRLSRQEDPTEDPEGDGSIRSERISQTAVRVSVRTSQSWHSGGSLWAARGKADAHRTSLHLAVAL